ncbi:MAG: THUMP domain-containing protein [Thermofilaceae archaeon]
MLEKFNLIASTYRRREHDLLSELWYFLRELGDYKVKASTTGLPGLTVLQTSLNPVEVIETIEKKTVSEPWYFRYLLKIEPIESCVNSDIEAIKQAVLELAAEKIKKTDSYKIEIRKRLTSISRDEIINTIAPIFTNKVSLDNPDKIILIEIIGYRTGVAIIEPKHIVSIQRLRRQTAQL